MKEITDIVVDTDVSIPVDTDEETKVAMLTEKYLPVFMKIRELNEMKKEIDDKLTEIKDSLEVVMDKYEVKSIRSSVMNITKIDSSTSTSFDITKLKKEDANLA